MKIKTIRATARYFGVSSAYVARCVRAGLIKTVVLMTSPMIDVEDPEVIRALTHP